MPLNIHSAALRYAELQLFYERDRTFDRHQIAHTAICRQNTREESIYQLPIILILKANAPIFLLVIILRRVRI